MGNQNNHERLIENFFTLAKYMGAGVDIRDFLESYIITRKEVIDSLDTTPYDSLLRTKMDCRCYPGYFDN